MSTVTALEAKTRFGELLDRVARGEEIVITRHDKPVARIVPEGRRSLERVRRAVEDIARCAPRWRSAREFRPLTDKEIKDAINEGRGGELALRGRFLGGNRVGGEIPSPAQERVSIVGCVLSQDGSRVVPVLWIIRGCEFTADAVATARNYRRRSRTTSVPELI